MRYTYPKAARLKQKKQVSLLFEKGKWRSCGNMRVIVINIAEATSPNVGVSVSKRNFKKAVDRNRVKRLLREAYRLNKQVFHAAFGENCHAMLFWAVAKMPADLQEVENELKQLCNTALKK